MYVIPPLFFRYVAHFWHKVQKHRVTDFESFFRSRFSAFGHRSLKEV